jgi:hypothetical protein
MNAHLAETIEVVDLDATVAGYRANVEARDPQPA